MAKNKENTTKEAEKKEKKVKNKKPNIFVRMGRKIKEVFSELKKVTWPSFGTVMKQLGAVLLTVLIVLVLIMLIDLGLSQLLRLVQGPQSSGAAMLGGLF